MLARGSLIPAWFSPSGDRGDEPLFSLLIWIHFPMPMSEDMIRQESGRIFSTNPAFSLDALLTLNPTLFFFLNPFCFSVSNLWAAQWDS